MFKDTSKKLTYAQAQLQETSICSSTTARDLCLLKHNCKRLICYRTLYLKTSFD
ncbi:hypothetical protein MtrunA17_Chr1g0173801 [Medicago truncatula]|uniref:Uncharacterized protein n=1 Tax=Medicago truncatula TaxID=3880 RepID=A0A396JLK4_MEDTR|nr:hypothetical protein MtrunA17_Chr1g0173801 [Medicago truncatula]